MQDWCQGTVDRRLYSDEARAIQHLPKPHETKGKDAGWHKSSFTPWHALRWSVSDHFNQASQNSHDLQKSWSLLSLVSAASKPQNYSLKYT